MVARPAVCADVSPRRRYPVHPAQGVLVTKRECAESRTCEQWVVKSPQVYVPGPSREGRERNGPRGNVLSIVP